MGEEVWKEKNVKYLRPNDLNQRKKKKERGKDSSLRNFIYTIKIYGFFRYLLIELVFLLSDFKEVVKVLVNL